MSATVRLPVLLYHHVGPNSAGLYPSLTVSPGAFEEHLRWLAEHGYVGIRPSDWLRWRRDGASMPDRPVLLTFDDGYADLNEYAFPALRDHGFSAAVFIVTGRIGGTNAWDEGAGGLGTARLLTSDQIRTWAAQIEFGSHSRTHADLTAMAGPRLEEEVTQSQAELAAILGAPATAFAYPYGSHNEAVRRAASHTYEIAFSVEEGLNDHRTDLLCLKRMMMWPGETTRDLAWKVRWGWSPLRRLRTSLPLRSLLRGRSR